MPESESEPSSSADDPPRDGDAPTQSVRETIGSIKDALAELAEYVSFYFCARADQLKVTARRLAIRITVGILLAIVVLTAIVTASVLLCRGIAGGLAALFNCPLWVGDLVGGLVFLGGILVALTLIVPRLLKWSSLSATMDKYERRRRQQRTRFGRDVGNWQENDDAGN